jgi:hypothetical protein
MIESPEQSPTGLVRKLSISIWGSRWFYLGVPLLCIAAGLISAFNFVIAGAINETYFPVVPNNRSLVLINLSLGLAGAGLATLLAIAVLRFGLKSRQRSIVVVLSLIAWGTGAAVYESTAPRDPPTYQRIYRGTGYSIPWGRVPGNLTGRNNSRVTWSSINEIGLRYCVSPFDAQALSTSCKYGQFMIGNVATVGLSSGEVSRDDPDARKLLERLLQPDAAPPPQNSSGGGTVSTSSTGSSSTSSSGDTVSTSSGGSVDGTYGRVVTKRIGDIAGMMAFESEPTYPSDRKIYLFAPVLDADRVHYAICTPDIENGQVVSPSMICTHYERSGALVRVSNLLLDDTPAYRSRMQMLDTELIKFRVDTPYGHQVRR